MSVNTLAMATKRSDIYCSHFRLISSPLMPLNKNLLISVLCIVLVMYLTLADLLPHFAFKKRFWVCVFYIHTCQHKLSCHAYDKVDSG